MHFESISNGLGSQSMWLLAMAAEGILPATVSITGDTGAEHDRLWNTGRRSSAKEYFDAVVDPYAHEHGIDAVFSMAEDRDKEPLPSLQFHTEWNAERGNFNTIKIPVFGSDGGRLKQNCTDKWKVRAINQELRRRGATTARTAQGIHFGEADRRVKGRYIGEVGGWETYQTTIKRNGVEVPIKWLTHYYPMVDRRERREDAREQLERRGIPYLVTSECDLCPHQDYYRWMNHTPESLATSAALEAKFRGQFFLTDRRKPLMVALEEMRVIAEMKGRQVELDFGCGNSYCGV